MRVDADAVTAGRVIQADGAGARCEVAGRVFGVDAALDGVAGHLDILLGEFELLAARDEDLAADEVDIGDFFSDAVLHLDARVHLHEVIFTVLIDEELDCAGVLITDCLGEADGDLAHLFAELRGQERGRGFLDQLLVAALHGAVAFTEVDDFAVFVAQELELNVSGLLDILFDVDAAVTESLFGFGAGALKFFGEGGRIMDDAHPFAAATGDSLDDDRKADALGFLDGFALIIDRTVGARHAGNLGFGRRLAGHGFVAH